MPLQKRFTLSFAASLIASSDVRWRISAAVAGWSPLFWHATRYRMMLPGDRLATSWLRTIFLMPLGLNCITIPIGLSNKTRISNTDCVPGDCSARQRSASRKKRTTVSMSRENSRTNPTSCRNVGSFDTSFPERATSTSSTNSLLRVSTMHLLPSMWAEDSKNRRDCQSPIPPVSSIHMFSKLKQFKDIRDKAKSIQSALAEERIEGSAGWGKIKVMMDGNQRVTSISIDPELMNDKAKVENTLKEAFNDAIEKVQKVMASKLKDLGGLDLAEDMKDMMGK